MARIAGEGVLMATVISAPAATRDFAAGFWRLADPKITLASVASMLIGVAAAGRDGPLAPGWLALTVLGIFCVEVAKNASGEVVDYDSGTDLAITPAERSPFSGGKRVMVDGLLSRRETVAIAGAFYAAAVVIGLLITLVREPAVFGLALVGVLLAWFYHSGPLRLAYRGLGELAVALAYGPLIAAGTYLVQRGEVTALPMLAAIPLGLLVAAFLWINEFPDCRADRDAGKLTLVVRLGRERATLAFGAIFGVAFALLAVLPALGIPAAAWLGFIALPTAVMAWRGLRQDPASIARIVPAQGLTLLTFVLYAAGTAAGLAFG
jgi:1,4-dihydroxy-2-naphthoate octaprenyltransferase